MKRINFIWFFLFFIVIFVSNVPGFGSTQASEKHSEKKPYVIPEVTSKVKVDGILDDKIWEKATVISLNYEVDPGENISPPVKTEVYLAYDPDHLYVAFRAYDPNPSAIRARFTDRDQIWDDDYVGIVLDTFNDSRRTYNFYCNPHGIQADKIELIIMGGDEWDGIWNSAGKITQEGYNVEMTIPFSTLRFQRKKGNQVWGIDAIRNYPRNVTHTIGLFPRERGNNCYMCQAEKITGFRTAKPGKSIEFNPTLSALYSEERDYFPEGNFKEKTKEIDPGLTFRWRFSPNLTFNATVNPDYSHVEADAAQLEINNQFALFYPEKRPFFMESTSIFITRFYVVHTRTIMDPDWGVKMTGKGGGHALGFFSVQDNVTNLLFPSSHSSDSTTINLNNQSTVLRYRHDLGKSSSLGVVLTDREGEEYFNRLAGLDLDLRFTKSHRIMFQFLGSQTHYPDYITREFNQPEGNFWGNAYTFLYQHTTERLIIFARQQQISEKFRADLGYMPQANFRFRRCGFQYFWRHDPGYWYTYIRLGVRYDSEVATDTDKNLIYKAFHTWIDYHGPLQTMVTINAHIGKRGYNQIEFDDAYVDFNGSFRPSGSLLFGLKGYYGDQIDYDNARSGQRLMINPIFQYNIGRKLYIGLDHLYEKLDVDAGRLYSANLSNFRFVYQFNRRTFIRTILQYAHYNYNSDVYTFFIDPKFRHLFSQILFSYKVNPQTVLFFGYSDDHFGYLNIPLTQNNRTFFLKIGYALSL